MMKCVFVFLFCFVLLHGIAFAVSDQDEYPVIFSNFNTGATLDGPSGAATFMPEQDMLLKSVTTYHWNGGRGSIPGQISIYTANGGHTGTWQASARPGYLDAPNVYWDVFPDVVLKSGILYFIEDSDTLTWSCNAQSGNIGFFELRGIPLTEKVNETAGITEASTEAELSGITESRGSDPDETDASLNPGTSLQSDEVFLQFETDTEGFILEKESSAKEEDELSDCYRLYLGEKSDEQETGQLPARVSIRLSKPLPEGASACITVGIPYVTEEGEEGILWDYVTANINDRTAVADIDFSYYDDFIESIHFSGTTGTVNIKKASGEVYLISLMLVENLKSAQGHFVLKLRRVNIQEYTGKKKGLTSADLSRILDDLESIWKRYIDMGFKNVRDLTKYPLNVLLAPIEADGFYCPHSSDINKGYLQLKYTQELGEYGYRSKERKFSFFQRKDSSGINEEFYRTMAHEMFHYFQNQYISSAIYRKSTPDDWVHEGTATYFENVFAKAEGIHKLGAAIYNEQCLDVYSGIISMEHYPPGGYARRPFFQYLEDCIGTGTIKKLYETYEAKALAGKEVPSFTDLLPVVTGKTLEELAENFYLTLVTTNRLDARNTAPWRIYNIKDEDFHNDKRNHPERAYLNTLQIKGDDALSSDCRWDKTITVYPYGTSFIKLIPEKLPGMVTDLIVSSMDTDVKLTVMTFTGKDYDGLQVYAGRDSVTVPVTASKILVMLTDVSGTLKKASISVIPAFSYGKHPTGKEKNMPVDYDGSLTYYNAEGQMLTVPAKATISFSDSEGEVKVDSYDKSYSFTVRGTYRSENGLIYGKDSTACITGAADFAQEEYHGPFAAQVLSVDLTAYQYGTDGKIIASFKGYGGGITEEVFADE